MTHAFPTRRSSDLAVGAGVCEIALTNSYYYIRMANGDNAGDRKVTEHVKLGFPSLTGQGAHINISGGGVAANAPNRENAVRLRSEEHTSELQSLMRISYAVFCLKKKTQLSN